MILVLFYPPQHGGQQTQQQGLTHQGPTGGVQPREAQLQPPPPGADKIVAQIKGEEGRSSDWLPQLEQFSFCFWRFSNFNFNSEDRFSTSAKMVFKDKVALKTGVVSKTSLGDGLGDGFTIFFCLVIVFAEESLFCLFSGIFVSSDKINGLSCVLITAVFFFLAVLISVLELLKAIIKQLNKTKIKIKISFREGIFVIFANRILLAGSNSDKYSTCHSLHL